MEAIVKRYKEIINSENSPIKLSRMQTLKEDMQTIFHETNINVDDAETLIEMNEEIEREIERVEHSLDSALAMRRHMF